MNRVVLILLLAAASPLRAQVSANISVGSYLEDNDRVGDQTLLRLSVPLTIGLGSPRSTQIEIDPSVGWHSVAGTTDASGVSWTRVRAWHLFGAAHRLSQGPDFEVYLKTETQTAIGNGYNRVMPGWQIAYRFHREFRATFRVRYEFSETLDPGAKSLHRIVARPTIYFPPAGRLTSWIRTDIGFDTQGAPTQYNIEGSAGLRVGPMRRLTIFAQPRVYIGAASRTTNLWRLRTGLIWSLGDVVVRHAPGTSDLRRPTFGESSPSKP